MVLLEDYKYPSQIPDKCLNSSLLATPRLSDNPCPCTDLCWPWFHLITRPEVASGFVWYRHHLSLYHVTLHLNIFHSILHISFNSGMLRCRIGHVCPWQSLRHCQLSAQFSRLSSGLALWAVRSQVSLCVCVGGGCGVWWMIDGSLVMPWPCADALHSCESRRDIKDWDQ